MRTERAGLLWVNAPLGVLAGLVLLLAAASRISILYDGFVGPYVWRPLVYDQGFNIVNTLLLLVILALMALWLYRLLRRNKVRIEIWLVFAGLHVQPAGSMLRALEDSDYFAPYDETLIAVGAPPGATCVSAVGADWLHQCLGLLFITPIIYVWILLLVAGLGVLALAGQRVSDASGRPAGRAFFVLTLVAALALYLAWAASRPTYVRLVIPAWWMVFSLAVAAMIFFAFERHLRRQDWRATYFAYNTVFFLVVGYAVAVWLGGGVAGWRPSESTRPWLLSVALVASVLLVGLLALVGRLLSRADSRGHGGGTWALAGVAATLLGIAIFFLAGTAIRALEEPTPGSVKGLDAPWALSALTLVGLVLAAAFRAGRTRWAHASLDRLRDPLNLLLIGGQFLDALMTSIGLDVYGATEKHVLPRTLVQWVDGLDLPGVLDQFPTMLAFIPYKILLVLGLIWALDVRFRDHFASRHNTAQLVKGIALIVGFSPGLRDAIRLAMGV